MKKILLILGTLGLCCYLIGYGCMAKKQIDDARTTVEQKEWEQKKFDLREKLTYKQEYQIRATAQSCWVYAALDSVETNLMLQKGINYDFSESYVEYMTSEWFGKERKLNSEGSPILAYTFTGDFQGLALESEIPNRVYETDEIDLLKNASQIVKEIQYTYYAGEWRELNKIIKKHLVNNGSVSAECYFDPKDETLYNPKTHGYYAPGNEINHAISIIGWDDMYAKENFPEENRPQENGAYLVNCFWKDWGIIYIPYEDVQISSLVVGVLECRLEGDR